MLQAIVVGLIVLVAAAYAAWALAPRTLRLRIVTRALECSATASPCPAWLRARLGRMANGLTRSACADCGSNSGAKPANADVTRKHPHQSP